ncbi:MAG: hypothetical protein JXR60_03180 [Bacteroidales bacterium]|nr:hypothetical protein [Bacteroidales bacterium]
MKNIKVGILKETKTPPDKRVVLSPNEAKTLTEQFPNVELYIQKSENRCFRDEEYAELGLNLVDSVDHCDILMGVKEVKIEALIPNKKYLFFSHTAKEQEYNKPLLKALLNKKIQIIDHEYLTDENGARLVAFGRWAGLVGAYNGLLAYGLKTKSYQLKRANACHDLEELKIELNKVKLDPVKILITGGGRVAHGAMEILNEIDGIEKVTAQQFLKKEFDHPVYCQIDPWHYLERNDGLPFDFKYFVKHPCKHTSTFKPYTKVTDLFIACHFWDEKSPVFMTNEDMLEDGFKINLIADVSCDIHGPIPSTIRPSTIAEPLYGYNAKTKQEVGAFDKEAVTVMAVDNLPGELPRNASNDFGNGLLEKVFPSLFGEDDKGIIHRASITTLEGKLNDPFLYLEDFLNQ